MTLQSTTCLLLAAISTTAAAELETNNPLHLTPDATYYKMLPAGNGGVIALGEIKDASNKTDIGISRIAPDMSTAWTQVLSGTNGQNDWLLDACSMNDGSFVVLSRIEDEDDAGWIDRKLVIAKFTSDGVLQWSSSFDDSGLTGSWESPHKARLAVGPDGRICMVENILYESLQVRSLASNGQLQWTHSVDNLEFGTEMALSIEMNAAGDMLIGGLFSHQGDTPDAGHFYTSLSSSGSVNWTQYISPEGFGLSELSFINVDSEGNWITSGTLTGGGWIGSAYAARLTPAGTLDWMTHYVSPEDNSMMVMDTELTNDDELVLGGFCWSPLRGVFSMKIDKNGAINWVNENQLLLGDDDHTIRSIAVHDDGRIEMAGSYNQLTDDGNDRMQLSVTMSKDGNMTDISTWNPSADADSNNDVVVDSQDQIYTCGQANTTGVAFQFEGSVMRINSCPADVSGDDNVTVTDLLMMLAAYGTDHSGADLNNDGTVDVSDVLIILENWNGCAV